MTNCAARLREAQYLIKEGREHANQITTYFGVRVKVLIQMEHCSLILFRDQKSIVSTADLCSANVMDCAA